MLRRLLRGTAIALGAAAVVDTFIDTVASIGTVAGRAMQPTINPGSDLDVMIFNKMALWRRQFDRGDVYLMR